MLVAKLVQVTRCVTRNRLTFEMFFEAVVSYDVVLWRINRLERFTVSRLETTSNRPEQYKFLWRCVSSPLEAFFTVCPPFPGQFEPFLKH